MHNRRRTAKAQAIRIDPIPAALAVWLGLAVLLTGMARIGQHQPATAIATLPF